MIELQPLVSLSKKFGCPFSMTDLVTFVSSPYSLNTFFGLIFSFCLKKRLPYKLQKFINTNLYYLIEIYNIKQNSDQQRDRQNLNFLSNSR